MAWRWMLFMNSSCPPVPAVGRALLAELSSASLRETELACSSFPRPPKH